MQRFKVRLKNYRSPLASVLAILLSVSFPLNESLALNNNDPLSVPESLGSVQESYTGNSDKTVFVIQDAHDSLEAQENIAALIHHLVEHRDVKTVLEEGYEGSVPSDAYFGFIKDPAIKERVSYFLMDQLRISGAEYAHINRKKNFELIGADNIDLHVRNVESYRVLYQKRGEIEQDLGEIETRIKRLVDSHLPKEVKHWIKLKQKSQEGKLSLLSYLQQMTALSPTSRPGESIRTLLRAVKQNDEGSLSEARGIDPIRLFKEIATFENSFANTLLGSPRDREILRHYKEVRLLKRLSDLEITAEEYAAVKETLIDLNTKKLAAFIAGQTKRSLLLSKQWEAGIQNAVRFYELAQQRDDAIERALETFEHRRTALVFGGFHKDRITAILRKKGISYYVIAVNITRESPRHQKYYKKLMQVGYDDISLPGLVTTATQQPTWPAMTSRSADRDTEFRSLMNRVVLIAERLQSIGLPLSPQQLGLALRSELRESSEDEIRNRIRSNLIVLYGRRAGLAAYEDLSQFLRKAYAQRPTTRMDSAGAEPHPYDQSDAVFITYPDSITDGKEGLPFQALSRFAADHLKGLFNRMHILPFFAWDADRGFSVLNYREVDPRFGSWDDIRALQQNFDLAFDLVANHASIDNPWIQAALIHHGLADNDLRRETYAQYKDFVKAYHDEDKPSDDEMDKVVHFRTSPLLSRYYVIEKEGDLTATFDRPADDEAVLVYGGWVWTTYSRPDTPDGRVGTRQIDLNYTNPAVLIEMLKVLRFYSTQGASIFRIDSAPILWKEPGKFSLHEPETRKLLQIINDALTLMNPNIMTIAEIKDEPATEMTYLGEGSRKESDLIYQFSSYPMSVYTILKGDARYFREWVPRLEKAAGRQLLLLAGSHDGFTVRPLEGPLDGTSPLIPEDERRWLIKRLREEHRAFANKRMVDGVDVVREVVTTPWDAINKPDSNEAQSLQVDRYVASLALGVGLRGIPTIYYNGLFGVSMTTDGLADNRESNRQPLDEAWVRDQLQDSESRAYQVYHHIQEILGKRAKESAMHPSGPPEVVVDVANDQVAALLLRSQDESESIVSLVNVSAEEQTVTLDLVDLEMDQTDLYELIADEVIPQPKMGKQTVVLKPYQVAWVKHVKIENPVIEALKPVAVPMDGSSAYAQAKRQFTEQLEEKVKARTAVLQPTNFDPDDDSDLLAEEFYKVFQDAANDTYRWIKTVDQSGHFFADNEKFHKLIEGLVIIGYGGIGRKMFYGGSSDIDWIFIFPEYIDEPGDLEDFQLLENIKEEFWDIIKRAVPNNQKRDIHAVSKVSTLGKAFGAGDFTPMDTAILAHTDLVAATYIAGNSELYGRYRSAVDEGIRTRVPYDEVQLMNYFMRRVHHHAFPDGMIDLKLMKGGFTEIAFLYHLAHAHAGFPRMTFEESLSYLQDEGIISQLRGEGIITAEDAEIVIETLRLLTFIRLSHGGIRLQNNEWLQYVESAAIILDSGKIFTYEELNTRFMEVVAKGERFFLKTSMGIDEKTLDILLERPWSSPEEFRKAAHIHHENTYIDNFVLWQTRSADFLFETFFRELNRRHGNLKRADWLTLMALSGNASSPPVILQEMLTYGHLPRFREQVALVAKNHNADTGTLREIAWSPGVKPLYRGQAVENLYGRARALGSVQEESERPAIIRTESGLTDPDTTLLLLDDVFQRLPRHYRTADGTDDSVYESFRQRMHNPTSAIFKKRSELRLSSSDIDTAESKTVSDVFGQLKGRFTIFVNLEDVRQLTGEQFRIDYEIPPLLSKNIRYVFYNDRGNLDPKRRFVIEQMQSQFGHDRIEITADLLIDTVDRAKVGKWLHVARTDKSVAAAARLDKTVEIYRFRYIFDETGLVPAAILLADGGIQDSENRVIDLSMIPHSITLEVQEFLARRVFERAA
ncbi:MAG: alpha-amylase family glycosyl hydrolase [Candidatus Omnitrophota bacterium]|nr:alpha-amylase family glycosyl hydrolase [Candidatus Omnitrophota bacterium]